MDFCQCFFHCRKGHLQVSWTVPRRSKMWVVNLSRRCFWRRWTKRRKWRSCIAEICNCVKEYIQEEVKKRFGFKSNDFSFLKPFKPLSACKKKLPPEKMLVNAFLVADQRWRTLLTFVTRGEFLLTRALATFIYQFTIMKSYPRNFRIKTHVSSLHSTVFSFFLVTISVEKLYKISVWGVWCALILTLNFRIIADCGDSHSIFPFSQNKHQFCLLRWCLVGKIVSYLSLILVSKNYRSV